MGYWKKKSDERKVKRAELQTQGIFVDRSVKYERAGTISIDEGLELIAAGATDPKGPDRAIRTLFGQRVNVQSSGNRLRTFQTSGTVCKKCGAQAEFFGIERSKVEANRNPNTRFHLNLWGTDGKGMPLLFTHDHIIPLSKDGKDHLKNCQTMCVACNEEKGSNV